MVRGEDNLTAAFAVAGAALAQTLAELHLAGRHVAAGVNFAFRVDGAANLDVGESRRGCTVEVGGGAADGNRVRSPGAVLDDNRIAVNAGDRTLVVGQLDLDL